MSVTPSNKDGNRPLPEVRGASRGWLRTVIFCSGLALAGCRPEGTTSGPPLAPAPASPQLETHAIGASVPLSNLYQFTSVLGESGFRFRHESGDSPMKAFPAANGSGIGVLDLDRDGLRDLLFLTNNLFEPGSPGNSNSCYRNLGAMQFSDVTAQCGLGFVGYSAGVAVGDFNSDGFSDVYLSCYGDDQLFENCGDGTFRNVTLSTGTNDPRWGTSAAFVDIDGDGLLDLYSGNYAKWSPEENAFCGDQKKHVRMYCSPKSVVPEQDVLYRNMGDGTFADVSQSSGILSVTGRTQGVLVLDLNDDGRTDLYITNDLNPNTLWVNQGNGQFVDQANTLGVAYDYHGAAQAGMGVTSADANRDGRFDLFVTNFEGEHNAYYEQDSGGFFSEVSHPRGLAAASIPWIGWGTTLADFDLDGWADVFVLNGHTDNNMHELGREGDYAQPPLFWRNERGQFKQVTPHASPFFQQKHPGRGLACADLDNDLDWDVLCNQQDLPPELLRNDSSRSSGATVLQLQLIGSELNRDAIGATVRCRVGERVIVEKVIGGGSYLCSSDNRLALVIPQADVTPRLKLEIQWGENAKTELELPCKTAQWIIRGSNHYSLQ